MADVLLLSRTLEMYDQAVVDYRRSQSGGALMGVMDALMELRLFGYPEALLQKL